MTRKRLTFMAGLVMSATALGSIISAIKLGKLADRTGHTTGHHLGASRCWHLAYCRKPSSRLLGNLSSYASRWGWRLVVWSPVSRPSFGITSLTIRSEPALGFSLSAQFSGQVAGPLIGGFIGGQIGMRSVFFGTSVLLLIGAAFNWLLLSRSRQSLLNPQASSK